MAGMIIEDKGFAMKHSVTNHTSATYSNNVFKITHLVPPFLCTRIRLVVPRPAASVHGVVNALQRVRALDWCVASPYVWKIYWQISQLEKTRG